MAAAVATQQVFVDIESLREVWSAPAHTLPLTALLNGTRPGVALSGTPDATQGFSLANGITVSGIPLPNNGQPAGMTSVYTTGTFMFPVTGATGATTQGTKVYYATDGSLTTAADDGGSPAVDYTFFGVVNLPVGVTAAANATPIKIGVVA